MVYNLETTYQFWNYIALTNQNVPLQVILSLEFSLRRSASFVQFRQSETSKVDICKLYK